MGMKDEIDAALQAHAAWRKRFKDYLSGHGAFDIDAVSATDQCDFGRWLDKEGHRLMPSDLHGRIREAHSEFHRVAAGIIESIKQRRFDEAHRDIAPQGALNQASARLAELLLKATLLGYPAVSAQDKPSSAAEPPAKDESPSNETPQASPQA